MDPLSLLFPSFVGFLIFYFLILPKLKGSNLYKAIMQEDKKNDQVEQARRMKWLQKAEEMEKNPIEPLEKEMPRKIITNEDLMKRSPVLRSNGFNPFTESGSRGYRPARKKGG